MIYYAWVYLPLHVIFCLTTTIHIHQNLTSSIKSTTSSYLSNVVLIFTFFALQLLTLVTLRRITAPLEYRMSIRNRKRLPNDYYDDSVDEVIKQDFTKDSMVYPPLSNYTFDPSSYTFLNVQTRDASNSIQEFLRKTDAILFHAFLYGL